VSRLPIRTRLTLVFALVMTVVLATLGTFLYVRLRSSLDDRVNERLELRHSALADVVTAGGENGLADVRFVGGDDGFAQVLDPNGAIVASFGREARVQLLDDADRRRAAAGRVVAERTIVGDDDPEPARLLASAAGSGSKALVVLVGESLEDRNDALDALLAELLVALPVALVVSSGIGYFVAGAALHPIEAMRRRAAEISSDTASRRLPLPPAHDEVYRLGETLNAMLDRLDAGLERERRFVADASHELRTPLALLETELELALRQPRTADELESALRSAAEETDRLVRLAEELLLVARADQGKLPVHPAPERASALIEEVVARFRSRADDLERPLEVEAPSDLVVDVDGARIRQALGNLVENALRYGEGTVRIRTEAHDGRVELHVTDDGAGFEPEFLPRAFERFSRADDARGRGGSGLGLAIVDAIARAHGGSAGAENRDGGGADVWMTLPVAAASRAATGL
jgi:two-component system, OmpR family, sensor kinase